MAGPPDAPRAGDVYRVALKGDGREQIGARPVVVIQDDDALPLSTRLCAPTSRSADLSSWRVEVEIQGEDTVALVEQLRVISNHRLTKHVGRISYRELAEIRAVAARLIGIP